MNSTTIVFHILTPAMICLVITPFIGLACFCVVAVIQRFFADTFQPGNRESDRACVERPEIQPGRPYTSRISFFKTLNKNEESPFDKDLEPC